MQAISLALCGIFGLTSCQTGLLGGSLGSIANDSPLTTPSAPISITSGGKYSGSWASYDSNTPAVTISTNEPVVIQNSTITSKGDLIEVLGSGSGANVTIQNVIGVALDPEIAGKQRGKFLLAISANALTVEHCTMTGVSFGVYVVDSTLVTLTVSNNAANDMEDRASDGHGGFTSQRPDLVPCFRE